MRRWIVLLIILMLAPTTWAATHKAQPLPPAQAFIFSAKTGDQQTIIGHWQIAPGYHLYEERLHFKPKDPSAYQVGKVIFPPGIPKSDPELGNYHVYQNSVNIPIPIIEAKPSKVGLYITYQGCAESGFCYPPITKFVAFDLSNPKTQTDNGVTIETSNLEPKTTTALTPQEKIKNLLLHHGLIPIILSFIGFGLLLSFTPCVLPMIPILSGIILGHGHHISTGKAFRLSLVYVLSMSFTYAIAGVLVGYIGGSLQAFLQKPWVLILFSLIFVLLALSLFGFYNIQPPQRLEAYIARITGHQKQGSYIGVIVMGCLGTLIVSPCVTPPLIGALSYISQSGDAFIGGVALFALGIGMGIPLLIIGTTGRKFLPHAGPWMNGVKSFLGVLLLGAAIYILQRILPGAVVLMLWATLLIGCAVYMGALSNGLKDGWRRLWRGFGIVLLVYGILMIIGAAMGNSNPLQPLIHSTKKSELTFTKIKNISELNQALDNAKTQNKPVMLDFYADWCIACKIMDRTTFADPSVQSALQNFILLRADVTANDAEDKALEQSYHVIAPPTILFFKPDRTELKNLRIVGETDAILFLRQLQEIQKAINTPSTSNAPLY